MLKALIQGKHQHKGFLVSCACGFIQYVFFSPGAGSKANVTLQCSVACAWKLPQCQILPGNLRSTMFTKTLNPGSFSNTCLS